MSVTFRSAHFCVDVIGQVIRMNPSKLIIKSLKLRDNLIKDNATLVLNFVLRSYFNIIIQIEVM